MLVPPASKWIDGTVEPPKRHNRTLDTQQLSAVRETPMHRIRDLIAAIGIADPSGAVDLFNQACERKGEPIPSTARFTKGVSRQTSEEEARRIRAEQRADNLREADRLYHQARLAIADFGDQWAATLRPVMAEALGDLSLHANEERWTACYELHRALVRLRAVSTVPGLRNAPWVYLIADVPAAFRWQLEHKDDRRLPWPELQRLDRKAEAVEIDLRGIVLPRVDEVFLLSRKRGEWGVGLFTAAEVVEHWRTWPQAREDAAVYRDVTLADEPLTRLAHASA